MPRKKKAKAKAKDDPPPAKHRRMRSSLTPSLTVWELGNKLNAGPVPLLRFRKIKKWDTHAKTLEDSTLPP